MIRNYTSINSTLLYTQLVTFKEDEFTARIAHSEKEVCELIEAGYEHFIDFKEYPVFRKRK